VTDDGYSIGKGKLFFQINAARLKNCTVESAQFPVPAEVYAAAAAVKALWRLMNIRRGVRLSIVGFNLKVLAMKLWPAWIMRHNPILRIEWMGGRIFIPETQRTFTATVDQNVLG